MRANFEFQILVLRALVFIIHHSFEWSPERRDMVKDLNDGITAIERERTAQESSSGLLDLL